MSTIITQPPVAFTKTSSTEHSPAEAKLGMSALSLRRQRLMGVAVLWLILVIMITVNALQSRALLHHEREQRMVTAVNIAVSTLEHFDERARQGQISLEEAKTLAFETIRDMRFGKDDNYLFALTGDLKMLAHPKRPPGQDLSQVTDPQGKLIFHSILDSARSTGAGFTDYRSNFARGNDAMPLVHTYTEAYAPWDVYVSSGIFMGDIS
ncbi:cache domain-containing protein [Vreelandella aquamarina]|uniref:cache domain-containing protein n=1 Tax=Vreelandella aquamarina TaxID=77097 RepID=UPI001CC6DEC3|nr:cache domain-containing protein [Halomonas aquamarina]